MSDATTGPRRGVFPVRPLGVGEVLDAAVTTIRAYPRVTLAPAAILYGGTLAAMLVLGGILTALVLGSDSEAVQAVAASLSAVGVFGAESLGGLVQLAAVAAFSTVMAGVVGRALFGRPAPLRAVWQDTKRSFGWLLLYAFLLNTAMIVPLILLVLVAFAVAVPVVGPYLYVAALILVTVVTTFFYAQVWLAPPAIVMERVHVIRGIARSWQITASRRWRATGIVALTMLICLLLFAAITAGIAAVASLVAYLLSISFSTLVTGIIVVGSTFVGGLLVGTAVTPFLSVVAAVAYVDQRSRTEGFDLLVGELRTSGRLRGLAVRTTLIGPGTVFAGPDDRRPPEPQPGQKKQVMLTPVMHGAAAPAVPPARGNPR